MKTYTEGDILEMFIELREEAKTDYMAKAIDTVAILFGSLIEIKELREEVGLLKSVNKELIKLLEKQNENNKKSNRGKG
jgi:hypothetical protein